MDTGTSGLPSAHFRPVIDETTIGRDATNDVLLGGTGTSRGLARIRRIASGYQLTDLDTTNGTRLSFVSVPDASY